MNISDAVNLFVAQSRQLCEALHLEGRKLSDIDLLKLRAELHILARETYKLQTYKDLNFTLDVD
jgi:hypothetical protein